MGGRSPKPAVSGLAFSGLSKLLVMRLSLGVQAVIFVLLSFQEASRGIDGGLSRVGAFLPQFFELGIGSTPKLIKELNHALVDLAHKTVFLMLIFVMRIGSTVVVLDGLFGVLAVLAADRHF